MAGLDENGFTPKTQAEIQEELQIEIEENLSTIGEVVNAAPSSRFGQLIDIFSAQMAEAWDGLQDIYNSYFPLTATGTSLDEANSLTNTPRTMAKSSQARVYLVGDLATSIGQGNRITVTNTVNDFLLSSKNTVGAPDITDYVIVEDASAIVVESLASVGQIEFGYDGLFVTVDWDATPSEIKTAIEGIVGITEVTVLGGFDGVSLGVTAGPGFCHVELVDTIIDKELVVNSSTLEKLTYLPINLSFQGPFINVASYALVARGGTIDLGWDGNYVAIEYDFSAAEIKTALQSLPNVTAVTVTGTFELNTAVTIQLNSATLGSNVLLQQNNALQSGTILGYQNNYSQTTPANTLSSNEALVLAAEGQLVTIKDAVAGWDAVYNPFSTIEGRPVESDADYRFRRYQELARQGTATAGGVREAVVAAINSDTYNVSIIENDTAVDVPGVIDVMPPHSFEVFVNALNDASTNNAIGQAIYDAKSLGIKPVSTDTIGRHGDVVDVNGESIEVPFSSTVDVSVYITVQRTIDADDYPSDGDSQIKNNLINFFTTFEIGQDVLNHRLYTPVNLVPGIIDLTILLDTSPVPTLPDDIAIDVFENAATILANIVVEDTP